MTVRLCKRPVWLQSGVVAFVAEVKAHWRRESWACQLACFVPCVLFATRVQLSSLVLTFRPLTSSTSVVCCADATRV